MKIHFVEVRGHPKSDQILMFFGRWLLAGPWESIFADFDRFWGPLGMPFGSKMGSENEVRKKSEKGWFDEARLRPPGSP